MTDRPRRSLAVYEAPPIPEGWHAEAPIRIVDPLGVQAAWIAPHRAGSLVAWFARPTPQDDWFLLLGGADGLPGGQIVAVDPAGNPAPVSDTGWAFVERDPTAVTAEGRFGDAALAVSYCCDDGLHVTLDAGTCTAGIGLRLRLRPGSGTTTQVSGTGVEVRFGPGPGPVTGFTVSHHPRLVTRFTAEPAHIDIVGAGPGQPTVTFTLMAMTA